MQVQVEIISTVINKSIIKTLRTKQYTNNKISQIINLLLNIIVHQ